ncbi:hypothetical protein BDA96_02G020200 [Sorghum bicolor]|uniref:Uncharacterized protein n=1 Tax=Sorghum bicolor TaxID=4558 RepID=A0A921UTW0_SORBI|nr:hypothetical protein BDA96_02G020200 [Sorghum bicolor]
MPPSSLSLFLSTWRRSGRSRWWQYPGRRRPRCAQQQHEKAQHAWPLHLQWRRRLSSAAGCTDNGTAVVNEFQEHHYQSTKQQDGDVLFFESYRV